MPIDFTCPHCHTRILVADQFAGKTGPCAHCKTKITIPAVQPPPGRAPVARPTAQQPKQQRPKPQKAPPQPAQQPPTAYPSNQPPQGAYPAPQSAYPAPPAYPQQPAQPVYPQPLQQPVYQQPAYQQPIQQNPYSAPAYVSGKKKKKRSSPATSGRYRENYGSARVGLSLIFWSTIVIMIAGLLMLLSVIGMVASIGAAAGQNGPNGGAVAGGIAVGLFSLLCIGIMLISVLVGIIGRCICIGAPRDDEKQNAIASLACMGASIAVAIIGAIIMGAAFGPRTVGSTPDVAEIAVQLIHQLLVNALGVGSTIYFILFCKSIGTNTRSKEVVKWADASMNWFLGSIGATVVFIVIAIAGGFAVGASGDASLGTVLGILMLLAVIILGIVSLVTAVIHFIMIWKTIQRIS